MPKRYSATARTIVDLHADSWSDEKDETTGRYKERVAIYDKLLYADQRWMQQRLFAQMDLRVNMADATPESLARSMPDLDMATVAASGDDILLRLIAEITDETGQPMPFRDEQGNLLERAAIETLDSLDGADVEFIRAEITKRNPQSAVVPVSPQDVSKAAHLGTTPAEEAQNSFRPQRD